VSASDEDFQDMWYLDWDEEILPQSCIDGDHKRERMVFNGGNPWFICYDCGTKLRDAAYNRVRKEWF
jgi:hypothetical protein